jgi:hypothetical protein
MRERYAARAARAYRAMQHSFHTRSGRYRRDGWVRLPGASAHLWPFARALVATLDLAGVGDGVPDGFDPDAEIGDRLEALRPYWDPGRDPPAYASDPPGTPFGGDRYHDDNAWVGLALIQLERLRPGSGWLGRAADLYRFALAGWASDRTPSPGGVFWVEQGRGVGARNHDRNTVSTAPNAELGLHIAELTRAPPAPDGRVGPREMYDWVLATLDASRGSNSPGTGPFWDKLRGDGTIDRAPWSYNQGNMVGLNLLLARAAARAGAGAAATDHLRRAEAIARKTLPQFSADRELDRPAFKAILARNLLLLHHATEDDSLRAELLDALTRYADWAWAERRDRRDRFHLPPGGVTLLNQSAIVQMLSLLAWDPAGYGRIA